MVKENGPIRYPLGRFLSAVFLLGSFGLAGCGDNPSTPSKGDTAAGGAVSIQEKVKAARAKGKSYVPEDIDIRKRRNVTPKS